MSSSRPPIDRPTSTERASRRSVRLRLVLSLLVTSAGVFQVIESTTGSVSSVRAITAWVVLAAGVTWLILNLREVRSSGQPS